MKNLSSIAAKNHDFNSILEKKIKPSERLKTLPNTPFLENHYINNNFFFGKRRTIKQEKYFKKNIPISIIQGEYDLLCPPINSLLFSKGLPKN